MANRRALLRLAQASASINAVPAICRAAALPIMATRCACCCATPPTAPTYIRRACMHHDTQAAFQQQHSMAWGAALLGFAAAAVGNAAVVQAEEDDPYAPPTTLQGMPSSVVLYQYDVCPFCCKVKAFLDYNNVPYSCVEVNPLTKAELKWSEYKKVPVVLLNGAEQVNDSSRIISRLHAELHGAPAPDTASWWRALSPLPKRGGSSNRGMPAEEEATWRRWVDQRFVRTITVNIYRSAGETWQTFDYITHNGNFSWLERQTSRVAGAAMMWAISGRLQKKYGIQGDLRQHLYDDANEWVAALGGRAFAGGSSPNLADLAVFGVVRSVVGTDTFRDLMLNTDIAPWYDRMVQAVGDTVRQDGGVTQQQQHAL